MKKQIGWGIFTLAILVLGLYSSGMIFNSDQSINQKDYDSEGLKFIGVKRRGRAEGTGTLITKSGEVYVGDFSSGRFDGVGQLILNDGSIYKGTFKKGKRTGDGQLHIPGAVEVFDDSTKPRKKPQTKSKLQPTDEVQEDILNEN